MSPRPENVDGAIADLGDAALASLIAKRGTERRSMAAELRDLRDAKAGLLATVRAVRKLVSPDAHEIRDAVREVRDDLDALLDALPRCNQRTATPDVRSCRKIATYAWHGDDEHACDEHVPDARRASELDYASVVRRLRP